jgi:hypothetical protein
VAPWQAQSAQSRAAQPMAFHSPSGGKSSSLKITPKKKRGENGPENARHSTSTHSTPARLPPAPSPAGNQRERALSSSPTHASEPLSSSPRDPFLSLMGISAAVSASGASTSGWDQEEAGRPAHALPPLRPPPGQRSSGLDSPASAIGASAAEPPQQPILWQDSAATASADASSAPSREVPASSQPAAIAMTPAASSEGVPPSLAPVSVDETSLHAPLDASEHTVAVAAALVPISEHPEGTDTHMPCEAPQSASGASQWRSDDPGSNSPLATMVENPDANPFGHSASAPGNMRSDFRPTRRSSHLTDGAEAIVPHPDSSPGNAYEDARAIAPGAPIAPVRNGNTPSSC